MRAAAHRSASEASPRAARSPAFTNAASTSAQDLRRRRTSSSVLITRAASSTFSHATRLHRAESKSVSRVRGPTLRKSTPTRAPRSPLALIKSTRAAPALFRQGKFFRASNSLMTAGVHAVRHECRLFARDIPCPVTPDLVRTYRSLQVDIERVDGHNQRNSAAGALIDRKMFQLRI